MEIFLEEFCCRRESVSDKLREGQSKSVIPEDIDTVRDQIGEDGYLTYSVIRTFLGISDTAIHSILHEHLDIKKAYLIENNGGKMPRSGSSSCPALNVDIEKPRYDQSTYIGRARHFLIITNPLNLLALPNTLTRAKEIVTKYRRGDSNQECLTEDELWKAKQLYDSAFHPDTGEKMVLIGRMSAQVPMNTAITGGMMIFYKSTPAVIFWQWLNQSFNAVVNYTNRAGDAVISDKQILGSYVLATTTSVATALGLNYYCRRLPAIYGRLVPFVAVVAANCVNIPIMRYEELKNGTPIYDEKDKRLGLSRVAAIFGISQVILSRVMMPVPSMGLTPFVMDHFEKKGLFTKYPHLPGPLQIFLLAFCLTFATPLCCALFVQRSSMSYDRLEKSVKEQLESSWGSPPKIVYYNKGL